MFLPRALTLTAYDRILVMISRDEFTQHLLESGLMSKEELDDWVDTMGVADLDVDDLAQSLTEKGTLTGYQAEAIKEGNYRDLVVGQYEILECIGKGGTGSVYKARHRTMKRIVALKFLAPAREKSEAAVRRFRREVEAIAQLSHPNVVVAHDAGEGQTGHYLVMELIEGSDLSKIVQAEGPMPIAEAVDCIYQAAQALEYAHEKGIVHRDIKPANLLRDRAGTVKVTDLGLARFSDLFQGSQSATDSLTQAGSLMGTVDYMAPEQALDPTDTDQRTDIYGLGCTLYYLLTGRAPYLGKSITERILKHRGAPIPSMRTTRQEIPAQLDALFRKMVAKEPAHRHASFTEVLRDLDLCKKQLGMSDSAPREKAPVQQPAQRLAQQPASLPTKPQKGMRKILIPVVTLLILGAACVLVWFYVIPWPEKKIIGQWSRQRGDGTEVVMQFEKSGKLTVTILDGRQSKVAPLIQLNRYRVSGWNELVITDAGSEKRFKFEIHGDQLHLLPPEETAKPAIFKRIK